MLFHFGAVLQKSRGKFVFQGMSETRKTPLATKGTPISNLRRSQKTPGSAMRTSLRLKKPFKSPLQTPERPSSPKLSPTQEMDILRRKIDALDEDISTLQKEYDVNELQEHIDKLHEYNDIKDTGQMLIGKLAEIEGKTTKSLYTEFGLDVDD